MMMGMKLSSLKEYPKDGGNRAKYKYSNFRPLSMLSILLYFNLQTCFPRVPTKEHLGKDTQYKVV